MHSGPGDSDVEQPAFLLDRLAVGAVRQRVRDGQRAVGEADQEHRIPFQALRGVQRRQCDALHDRWVAGVGALPQLGEQRAQVQRRPLRRPPRRRVRPARVSASHRSRALVPDGGSAVRPSGSSTARATSGGQFVARRVDAALGGALQRQQRLPDLLAAEEALAAAHLERDARLGERLLVDLGLRVDPVQHRDLRCRGARFDEALDLLGDRGGLGDLVGMLGERRRRARGRAGRPGAACCPPSGRGRRRSPGWPATPPAGWTGSRAPAAPPRRRETAARSRAGSAAWRR